MLVLAEHIFGEAGRFFRRGDVAFGSARDFGTLAVVTEADLGEFGERVEDARVGGWVLGKLMFELGRFEGFDEIVHLPDGNDEAGFAEFRRIGIVEDRGSEIEAGV